MNAISPISTAQVVPKEAPKNLSGSSQNQTEKPTNTAPEFEVGKFKFKGFDRALLPEAERMQITRAYDRLADKGWSSIVDNTFDMRDAYGNVQLDLLDLDASLLEKDWDFTVDSEGELLIVEGKDALTRREKEMITHVFEDHGFDIYMNNLAQAIVDRGVGSRGPELYMDGHGIGSYDITMDNMSDILRGRELMKDTKIRPVFEGPMSVWKPIEEYNRFKLEPMKAVLSQLTARAENIYEYEI